MDKIEVFMKKNENVLSELPCSILYVFDDSAKGSRWFKRQRILPQSQLFLCPITVDEQKKTAVGDELKHIGYAEVKVLDYIGEFNRLSFVERDAYLGFIADIGNKTFYGKKILKEYFKCPWSNWSFWWQSLVAEKNPMKSASFSNLIKLRTILNFQKKYGCKKIILDIENREVSWALADNAGKREYKVCDFNRRNRRHWTVDATGNIAKFFIYQARIFLRYLCAKIMFRHLKSSRRTPASCRYFFITPFPFVDEAALRKEIYRDRFFSCLQKEIEEKSKGVCRWLGLVTVINDFGYISAVRMARKIKEWETAFCIDVEYLGFKEYFDMVFLYVCVCGKYVLGLSGFIKRFRYHRGERVWSVFREEWMRSFCGTTLADNLFYYLVFKKAFVGLNKDTTILYVSENQGWEKMLNIAAKEIGGLKTVGYQHTSIRQQMLNCYNHYSEFQGSGYVQALPVPDYLGCVGNITAKVLRECGWDKDKVFVWGPMRYGHLKKIIEDFSPPAKQENSILIALTLEEKEAKETLLYAYQAFKDQKDIKIFIKKHYASLPVDKMCSKLSLELDQSIFEITDAPLEELLKKVKVVVVNSSTVALEAVASGCPVIVPRLVNTIDISPLTGFSSLGIYVSSPFELRTKVYDIIAAQQYPVLQKEGIDFIKRYFYFLEDNETFLGRLENVIFSNNNRADIEKEERGNGNK